MSLQLKLFLLFGGLIAVLVSAQWLMMRALTREVRLEFENAAVSVGRDMATALDMDEVAFFSTEKDALHAIGHDADQSRRLVVKRVYTAGGQVQTIDRMIATESDAPETGRGSGVWVSERDEVHYIAGDAAQAEPSAKEDRTVVFQSYQWRSGDHAGEPHDGAMVGNVAEKEQSGARTGARVVELVGDDSPEDHGRVQAEMFFTSHPSHNVMVRVDAPEQGNFLILETPEFKTRIPLPRQGISQSMTRVSGYLMAGSLAILALGLLAAGYLAFRLARPLTALSQAAQAVGGGRLGVQVREPSGDLEVRRAIEAFNGMSLRLRELDEAERRHRERRALSELGEIARGFAHTIRNPLNTLGLSVEQMATLAPNSPECRELAAGSQRQIKRIDQWIRSFLALASEGRGQSTPLDVAALAHDVALEALQNNGHDVKIGVVSEPGLPPVRGVAPELRAILQALTVNAVEASPAGGQVEIAVKAGESGGVVVEIVDDGPGIPRQIRDRLFTPHVTTKTHGSGMGLFLAHRLAVSRYRGALALIDRGQRGTKAILTLPKENDYDEDPHPGC